MDAEEAGDYDRAVNIVCRRKCSTSYIQRRVSIGYNKAASIVERMEQEGVVSPANHSGKREILVGNGIDRAPSKRTNRRRQVRCAGGRFRRVRAIFAREGGAERVARRAAGRPACAPVSVASPNELARAYSNCAIDMASP